VGESVCGWIDHKCSILEQSARGAPFRNFVVRSHFQTMLPPPRKNTRLISAGVSPKLFRSSEASSKERTRLPDHDDLRPNNVSFCD